MSERLSKVITEDVRPSSKRWTAHPQLFPQSVVIRSNGKMELDKSNDVGSIPT